MGVRNARGGESNKGHRAVYFALAPWGRSTFRLAYPAVASAQRSRGSEGEGSDLVGKGLHLAQKVEDNLESEQCDNDNDNMSSNARNNP